MLIITRISIYVFGSQFHMRAIMCGDVQRTKIGSIQQSRCAICWQKRDMYITVNTEVIQVEIYRTLKTLVHNFHEPDGFLLITQSNLILYQAVQTFYSKRFNRSKKCHFRKNNHNRLAQSRIVLKCLQRDYQIFENLANWAKKYECFP